MRHNKIDRKIEVFSSKEYPSPKHKNLEIYSIVQMRHEFRQFVKQNETTQHNFV